MKNAIIVDKATGAYYAGKIQGVQQWRQHQHEARRYGYNRAWNVLCDLNEADDESMLQLRVEEVSQ